MMDAEAKEACAQMLETLAKSVREGKYEVTHLEQDYPAERRWVGDHWEFFRTQDLTLTIKYADKDFQAQEIARMANYPES
jgi:hypothetical protein